MVDAGANAVEFACEETHSAGGAAKVEIITLGEPFK